MNKKILIPIIVLLILGTQGEVYYLWRGQGRTFDEKLVLLQKQISGVQDSVKADSQKIAALPQKEVENREAVRQKSQDELLTAAVARVAPAVVSVVISKDVPLLAVTYQNPFGDDPFFKDFNIRVPVYTQKGTVRKQVGGGTGFIVSADGYILTNKHVAADAKADYTVLLADGGQKPASVVYIDQAQDIAILKIDPPAGGRLPTVSFGDSGTLKLGQTVIAIGNALGEYNNSVSVGIISGFNRTIQAATSDGSSEQLSGIIQTDAAINPGNSGGPLLDLSGRVVGVNVATVSGASSISFSIPINVVRGILKSAINL